MVILAGDFNGLDDADVIARSSLNSIVNQPTRGANRLDRVYVNDSNYAVRVVASTVRSDHKAVIAYSGAPPQPLNKSRHQRLFRRRSPSQHALFLQYASNLSIDFFEDASAQTNFDAMYAVICTTFSIAFIRNEK